MDVFALYQLERELSSERLRVHQCYFDARDVGERDAQAALELCERGLALARQDQYIIGEVWYDREVGSVLHELGQTERAREHLERAVTRFAELGVPAGVASASNILGHIELSRANHARAIVMFTRYIESARSLGRKQSEAIGLGNLANVYLELGNPWRALELQRAGLEIMEQIEHNEVNVAWALSLLGNVYLNLDQTNTALLYLTDALQRQRLCKDDRYAAATLRSLAACALMRKEYDLALEAISEALYLAETTGDVLLRSGVLTLAAVVHLERDDFKAALEMATQALAQAQANSERLDQMRARAIIARAELGGSVAEGRACAAISALETVVLEASATGSGAVEVFALEHLLMVLRDTGQLAQALIRAEELRALEKRLAQSDTQRLATVLNAQLDAERERYGLGVTQARTEALEFVNADLQRLNLQNDALVEQLREQTHNLERLSHEDPLTGAYNRRHLEVELARAWAQTERHTATLCVAMIDIDEFKRVNDRYTHAVGDEVLKATVNVVRDELRLEDTICRYGGEEFVVLLPNVSLGDAVTAIERVRVAMQSFCWESLGLAVAVTISAGVASSRDAPDALSLVAFADAAQYRAKQSGRNRVVWHGRLPE